MKPFRCTQCRMYYDTDRYTECPHCASGQSVGSSQAYTHAINANKCGISNRSNVSKSEETVDIKNDIHRSSDVNSDESVNIVLQQEIDMKQMKQQQQDASGTHTDASDSKTIARYDFVSSKEPVVGWLVCTGGAYVGESFNLKEGKNHIGRAGDMDISLAMDDSISRERHATIIYDPLKRRFVIQAGEGNGLTYKNGEIVITFCILHAYDKIEIGKQTMMFIPFCSKKFSWDQNSEDEKNE